MLVVEPSVTLLWQNGNSPNKDDMKASVSWLSGLAQESRVLQGSGSEWVGCGAWKLLPELVFLFHPHSSAFLLQKSISVPILGPMTFLSLNSRFPILVPGPQQRLPPSHRGPP